MTPTPVFHPCCWTGCPHWATGQTAIAAPPVLGGKAVTWFCARHERMWQIAIGTSLVWVNYAFGRAPLVGWGRVQ